MIANTLRVDLLIAMGSLGAQCKFSPCGRLLRRMVWPLEKIQKVFKAYLECAIMEDVRKLGPILTSRDPWHKHYFFVLISTLST